MESVQPVVVYQKVKKLSTAPKTMTAPPRTAGQTGLKVTW